MSTSRPFCVAVCLALGLACSAALAAQLEDGFSRVALSLDNLKSAVLPRMEYKFEATGRTLHVARTGNDSNDGSKAQPWATFAHALSQLKPGDVLYARGGDYPTPVMIRVSGEPGRPIIISAFPGERVSLHQPPGWQRQHEHGATVELNGVKHVWLHGFVIEGCRGDPDAPKNDTYGQNGITLADKAGEGVRILNNIVSRAQHCGIKEMGHGGKRFLIEGNVVFHNGTDDLDHGVYIPSNEAIVRGNFIFRNKGYGIHLYETPSRCQIYNNVCIENGACGIIVSGANNVVAHNVCARNEWAGLLLFRGGCVNNSVVNNIFFNNRRSQIATDDGGGKLGTPARNLLDYNAVFPEKGWAEPAVVATWAGNRTIVTEPQTIDGWDCRIQTISPCRGVAGVVQLSGSKPSADIGLFPASHYSAPTLGNSAEMNAHAKKEKP
ncbi:MAG: right-handed parallel beta-helix repeat-containing protein [Verrucomicrobia bacterium]|nr:right-handed parallel beta-helix repeat-containing protein [Verrucomicrobiota bacterium]